jgi:23S rRNA G2445 N2-methylase RlmL
MRDVVALVDLLADDEASTAAARALGRVGEAALDALGKRLASARPPLRARIVKAIGRVASNARATTLLLAALDDADAKTRRNAAIALGHVQRDDIQDALMSVCERDERPEMRRSVAASLGKVGTARALPWLREASRSVDPELARIAGRACMMVERTSTRAERGRIEPARTAPRPVDLVTLARSGLEDLLLDELSSVAAVTDVRVDGPGCVRARLVGSMDALFAARTMSSFRFPVPTEWARDGETLADAIARAATSESARVVFATWTAGPLRYRIAWAEGGHKRAATWDAARAIAARAPDLVNDPTSSTWELIISVKHRLVDVAIAPRALEDPRFQWRRGDVPAASHPTIAAALARVAGVRPDDVVWDPFAGSGGELIERALLGPYRELRGSDIDPRALVIARENLAAARVPVHLEERDVLGLTPRGVTLIVTNPPMGRRASRDASLAETLDRFVVHAASVLEPVGRLVWIAPWPKRARVAAAGAGLALDWARVIDMGGFEAEMQRWVKASEAPTSGARRNG